MRRRASTTRPRRIAMIAAWQCALTHVVSSNGGCGQWAQSPPRMTRSMPPLVSTSAAHVSSVSSLIGSVPLSRGQSARKEGWNWPITSTGIVYSCVGRGTPPTTLIEQRTVVARSACCVLSGTPRARTDSTFGGVVEPWSLMEKTCGRRSSATSSSSTLHTTRASCARWRTPVDVGRTRGRRCGAKRLARDTETISSVRPRKAKGRPVGRGEHALALRRGRRHEAVPSGARGAPIGERPLEGGALSNSLRRTCPTASTLAPVASTSE